MKQVLLVFTLIFTSLNPRAQEKVTITAALKGLPPGVWVYCWGSRSHPHKDSVQSVADGFNMTVIVPKGDADRYVIQMDLPTIESMALYLEKGLVRITAPGPNFKDAVVAGGQAISDYNNYLKYVKNSPKHDSLTTLWILQHPGSPASAYILSEQLLSLDEKAAILPG